MTSPPSPPLPEPPDIITGPGANWSPTVKSTQNNVDPSFSDGSTVKAWDVTLSTKAGAGTSTTTSARCTNYTTGPSGRFGMTYTNAPHAVYGTYSVAANALIAVKLSNGTILTYKTSTTRTRSV